MPYADHKSCSRCGIDQPLKEYHKDGRNADGHTSTCRTCRNIMRKKRQAKHEFVPVDVVLTARRRALQKLVRKHRAEFEKFITQEKVMVEREVRDAEKRQT